MSQQYSLLSSGPFDSLIPSWATSCYYLVSKAWNGLYPLVSCWCYATPLTAKLSDCQGLDNSDLSAGKGVEYLHDKTKIIAWKYDVIN